MRVVRVIWLVALSGLAALPPAARATLTTQGWGPLVPERHGRN